MVKTDFYDVMLKFSEVLPEIFHYLFNSRRCRSNLLLELSFLTSMKISSFARTDILSHFPSKYFEFVKDSKISNLIIIFKIRKRGGGLDI